MRVLSSRRLASERGSRGCAKIRRCFSAATRRGRARVSGGAGEPPSKLVVGVQQVTARRLIMTQRRLPSAGGGSKEAAAERSLCAQFPG